jgi:hypothetical protein
MKKIETEEKWLEAKSGDVIKLEVGERITGIFKGIEESVLYPSSYALSLEIEGELKTLFVNSILQQLIVKNEIKINQKIAILYVGDVKNQSGTRTYKDYKLFYQ